MSKFSGKCDLADIIEIAGGFEKFKGTRLFKKTATGAVEIIYDEYKDIIDYLPYIEIVGFSMNGERRITLSHASWVDIEEEKYGHLEMHDVYRKYLQEEKEKYGLTS